MAQPKKRENHMQCQVIVDFVTSWFRNLLLEFWSCSLASKAVMVQPKKRENHMQCHVIVDSVIS